MRAFYLIEAVVSILLITTILLQQRGTSIGGAFSAEAAVYRSLRGPEKFLFFSAAVLSVVFLVVAVLILIKTR
jgi:protein translocase SecG subunit